MVANLSIGDDNGDSGSGNDAPDPNNAVNQIDMADQDEAADTNDQNKASDQNNTTDQNKAPGQNGRTDQTGRADHNGRTDQTGRADQSVRTDQNGTARQNHAANQNYTAAQYDAIMEIEVQAGFSGGSARPYEGDDYLADYDLEEELDEFCVGEMDGDDTTVDLEVVDTVIIFDYMGTTTVANTRDHGQFVSACSRIIDEYLESEDFKPILRLTQEQLLIDWLTSRRLLNQNGGDEDDDEDEETDDE